MWSGKNESNDAGDWQTDALAFSIYRCQFEIKALRLLKMTRAALIYLSLAIYTEERMRDQSRSEHELLLQMPLDEYDDNWKR